jgi:hypothetical protein
MKSCPTCNRTFEDTFTFCLIDGSILSAPFDPQATWQNPHVRNTDPPPTEVIPPPNFPNREALPPTMLSPKPAYAPPPINNAASYPQPPPQFPHGQYAVSSPQKRRPPIPWSIPITLAGLVLLVLIFGGREKSLSLWGLLIAGILSALNLIIARPNAQNTQGQYMGSSPQKKSATIPWAIPIALVGLWLISLFLFHFGGGLIHILLLAAIILFVINLSTGGRMAR